MSARPHQHRRAIPLPLLLPVLLLIGLLGPTGLLGPAPVATAASAADDPCAPGGSVIVCENSKPGTPGDQWQIQGPGDADIQGFATDISVDVGGTIDFKVDTDAAAYQLKIYRSGYYDGDGARLIATVQPSAELPQTQPECLNDPTTGLYDCGNWADSAHWDVPSTAVSGVYFAQLIRADNGHRSDIHFVVRDDESHSDVLFQTSDPTWQAYNTYGGGDFYEGGTSAGRAYKVSYNRPVLTAGGIGGRDFYWANEYPMVRFLEKNGYDVSYFSGVDTDRRGALLLNHQVFLSVGHDEYWSKDQRANVEAARDAGVNLQFLSGNEVYWKTRYEPSIDASQTDNRTLVTYKETWADSKIDPDPEWTGTWRDPRFASEERGAGRPENALTGTLFKSNATDLPVTVSAAEGKLRLWRNTSLASLADGTSAELAPHTVGYESDEDVDNGHRPAGLIDLSTTSGAVSAELKDFGKVVGPGDTTHHLTLYRAASGALVFGAGSVQWTWGLDSEHASPFPAEPADVRMQQAQVNLFADMGVQPATLAATLVPATASTDQTGPTATITSPADGSSQANGTPVTVTGTATDTGGRVAGVEVSTDGSTWHPASGTTSWSYTYVQQGNGSATVRVRAVDDSANLGPVATTALSVSCPCSVFGSAGPEDPDAGDGSAAELGLQFTPTEDGFVSGVRFYKSAANTGTHVGTLWGAGGAKLASATFREESATGWQTVTFGAPVAVDAGTTYVVSYTAPLGHYAAQPYAFSSGPLRATPLTVAGGFGAEPAGVYAAAGGYPNRSYRNTNYFVDPLFLTTAEAGLAVSTQSPLDGATSVPTGSVVRATLSKAVVAGTQGITVKDSNGQPVPGATSYDAASRTITFTPQPALDSFVTYQVTVSGTDAQGHPVSSGGTWQFTTAKPAAAVGVCPCRLYDDASVPTTVEADDNDAVELGVTFRATVDGTVTGVRFYKGPGNIGTHTGSLWTAAGTRLATGTFTDESSTGWQTLTFSSPVEITKNTAYVASYRTSVGRYSVAPNAFATGAGLSRGPLVVSSTAGAYGYTGGVPTASSSSSYMVDVSFEKAVPPLTITGQDPAPGATGVSRQGDVAVSFSDPIATGASLTLAVGGTTVAGAATLSPDGTTLTFRPAETLPADTEVTVRVADVVSRDGARLDPQSWTYRTDATDAVQQSLFGDEIPAVASADDASPVELGVSFTPTQSGTVSAIRFFKGAGNLGTHVGSIWSAAGSRLAQVTFTGETTSGWQTARLASPLAVTAGTSYVVSYLAPQGHYSYTSGYFAAAHTSGDLTAPAANNGRYLYGAAGGLPEFTYGAANYFVDVVFTATADQATVTGTTPAAGATGVARSTSPSVSYSAPVLGTGYTVTAKVGTATVAGTGVLSADGRSVVFTPNSALPADSDVTMTVSGVRTSAGQSLPTTTWTFHTESADMTTTSMFDDQTPATAAVDDSDPVELGVAFKPAVDGRVQAIRFYKGPGNGGAHTGSLWSASGQRLATVAFTGESASGWQTATLSTPVDVTGGTTYVVSYYAPQGHYAVTSGFFGSSWVDGPLTAPAAGNGRFLYAAGGGFPTGSFRSGNYFVDVVFSSAALSMSGRTPASGATGVEVTAPVTVSFSQPVSAGGSLALSVGGSAVPGTSQHAADGRSVTFTPDTALPADTDVTVTLSGITATSGASLAPQTWTFRTEPAGLVSTSLFADQTPATAAADDSSPIELGVRFTPSTAGTVTALRFYKGAGNTGTHTGSLWTADGALLARATFSDETASGWQTARLDSPVALTAGTTYVVSYFAPHGHYAVTGGYFGDAVTSGPLTAPATGNGRYVYDGDGGFPTATHQASNYFVDVVFRSAPEGAP